MSDQARCDNCPERVATVEITDMILSRSNQHPPITVVRHLCLECSAIEKEMAQA